MAFCPDCRKKLDEAELRRNRCDACGSALSGLAKPNMGRGTLVPGSFDDEPVEPNRLTPPGQGSGAVIGTGTLVPPPFGAESDSGSSNVAGEDVGKTITGPLPGEDAPGLSSDANTGTIVGMPEDPTGGTHVDKDEPSAGGGTVVDAGEPNGSATCVESSSGEGNATFFEPGADAGGATFVEAGSGAGGATFLEPGAAAGGATFVATDLDGAAAGGATVVDPGLSDGSPVGQNDRTVVGGFDEPVPERDWEGDRTVTAEEILNDADIGRTINVADLPAEEQAELFKTIADPGLGESFGVQVGGGTILDSDLAAGREPGKSSAQRIVSKGAGAETNLVLQTRGFVGGDVEPVDPNMRADYEILKELGKGGMGVVYEARQTSIDRAVALKVLKDQLAFDKWQRESFLSEAVVTGDLDHPNIVPIYDVGRNSKNALFYAMKKVVGTPWHKVVRKKQLHENLEILLKCCDAVAFAHSRGVVHRDLKPENVMLGDFGEVLVMDWGLAITTNQFIKGDMITQTTSMGGSPAYMAPELATGPLDRIRPWSDVYLLGAILYEIVTGTPPHAGRSVSECLRAARENIIAPTNKTGELVDIAVKAMATRPQDRYADVKALQTAIREYLSHLESLGLSERAQRDLEKAKTTDDYREYARSVFAFEEAVNLWNGNNHAREGLVASRLAYASSALRKGDYDLGLSLLDAGESRHADTITRLKTAQKDREQRTSRLRNLRRIAAGLLIAIFVGGSTGSYLIYREKLRADENAKIAKTNEETAKKNEAEALRQEGIAKANEKKANDNFEEAVRQEKIARQNAEEAKRQEQEAKRQELIAKTNEKKAIENAEEALRQEQIAKTQEMRAKESAAEAIKQAKIAEENALLAEWEGFQSELRREQAVKAQAAERVQRTRAEIARNDALYEGYVSQIGLAASKTDVAAFDAARDLLRDLAQPEFAGFRGWEYDRLKYLCEQAQAVLAVGPQLTAGAISPGGDLWAVGGRDGKVRLYQLPDLKLLGELVHGHAVSSVAFDPAGKRLATAGDNTAIRLWNVSTRELQATLTGHEDHVLSVRFSPRGDELVSSCYDATARLWNVATGETKQVLLGHSWHVRGTAWSQDGKTLLTAGEDRRVVIWNRGTDGRFTRAEQDFTRHEAPIGCVAMSNDGQFAASGDEAGRIWFWRITDPEGTSAGSAREFPADGHTRAVTAIAFASDSSGLLLSTSDDNTAKLWDVAGGKTVTTLRGHGNAVKWGQFGRIVDGKRFVHTVGFDGKAIRWDTTAYAELKVFSAGDAEKILADHDDEVLAVAFDGGGRRMVTSSRDQSAVVWDVASGKELAKLSEGHAFGAVSAVWLAKSGRLVTAALDQTGRVWDVERGAEVGRLDGIGTTAVLAASPDERWLATGDDANNVLIWDLPRLLAGAKGATKPVAKLDLRGSNSAVTAVGFRPDGRGLAVGTSQGEIEVWSLPANLGADGAAAPARQSVLTHGFEDDQVTACVFIGDGSELLSAGFSGSVLRWNVSRGEPVGNRYEHLRAVRSVAVSADGTRFVSVRETNGADDTLPQVTIWRLDQTKSPEREFGVRSKDGIIRSANWNDTNQEIFTTAANTPRGARFWRVADGSPIADKTFAEMEAARPDFGLLLSGSTRAVTLRGGEARIWNLSNKSSGGTLSSHQAVPAVAISGDGKFVATGSLDGTIKLWDAETGKSIGKINAAHPRGVRSVAFLPGSNEQIVSSGDDQSAKVWVRADAEKTDAKPKQTFSGHAGRLTRAVPSADGKKLLTTADDGSCRVWNLLTGEMLVEFKQHTGPVIAGDLSSDGQWAISADEASVWIWEVATGKPVIAQPIQGHGGDLTDVRFFPIKTVTVPGPGGQPVERTIRRVVTASLDGTSKLWDIAVEGDTGASVGKELLTLSRPRKAAETSVRPGVTAVSIDPTGRTVATGDRSGSAVLFLSGAAE